MIMLEAILKKHIKSIVETGNLRRQLMALV